MIEAGMTVVWGVGEIRPIVNVPHGCRVRIRQRYDRVTTATVHTHPTLDTGVEQWGLEEIDHPIFGKAWKLGWLIARNHTV